MFRLPGLVPRNHSFGSVIGLLLITRTVDKIQRGSAEPYHSEKCSNLESVLRPNFLISDILVNCNWYLGIGMTPEQGVMVILKGHQIYN